MDMQREEAKVLAKQLPFKKKVDHIWTYYKWWIISFVVIVLLIVGTIYDVATRPSYDLEIALYSKEYISEERATELGNYLSAFVPDIDGDGVKEAKVYPTSVAMIGDEGDAATRIKLTNEVLTAGYPVFIVDDSFYEILQMEGYRGAIESFRDMSKVPEFAQILQLTEETTMYWGTTVLYDEKHQDVYQGALETELAIFGPRE